VDEKSRGIFVVFFVGPRSNSSDTVEEAIGCADAFVRVKTTFTTFRQKISPSK
jgi:hypothetical protein